MTAAHPNTVASPDLPLNTWLDHAAAKQPTPGGGSAAAIAGALGAAMGEMTLTYSVGRKANSAEDESALSDLRDEMSRVRVLLLRLSEEDQVAYGGWQSARKLDDTDPAKAEALRQATAASIAVPQAIGAAALSVLRLAIDAAPRANPWLLSDLLVCGDLATAAVRAAGYNVEANLADLERDEVDRLRREVTQSVELAVERVRRLHDLVAQRRKS